MMEFRPSVARKATGWCLIVLGVFGTVLPFLQGFLFLVLGTFVLRHQYLWAHRGLGWVESRWPDAVAKVEGMEARLIERVRGGGRRIRATLTRGR
ncbi:PGPGW domain-containing protein [Falsiroseomonas oryziterrae]|uniref:PGPGW domain-containing protein n=1 Tax=Falsiroseomonas oryziterrae TaxID=2911368 RepID=UPI001F37029B|nr:PGPGW domain-containing protein [Roseomonas sp. NPKOSM-4]